MRPVLALFLLVLSGSTSLADDLPLRFIGVWLLEDAMHPGHAETCSRADYKPGYQTNDRIVLIDRKGLTPIEGGCRIISVKEGTLPNPRFPQITPAVTVRLMCAAEGEEKESATTAVWSIHSIAGRIIMVQVNAKEPTKVDIYQKCP